jgi:hypothetical protein
MFKKSVISLALFGIVALAIASSGGGGTKKTSKAVHGLELVKTGSSLRLSMRSVQHSTLSTGNKAPVGQETIRAYRKGNIFYILPTSYQAGQVSMPTAANNLNALQFKLRMGK